MLPRLCDLHSQRRGYGAPRKSFDILALYKSDYYYYYYGIVEIINGNKRKTNGKIKIKLDALEKPVYRQGRNHG